VFLGNAFICILSFYFCFFSNNENRHSTDREVALMILMAYLSYMLAEVRFSTIYKAPKIAFCYYTKKLSDSLIMIKYFIYLAAILFKCYPHSILLWNCYVSLHMA
jgi:hypothetical protein